MGGEGGRGVSKSINFDGGYQSIRPATVPLRVKISPCKRARAPRSTRACHPQRAAPWARRGRRRLHRRLGGPVDRPRCGPMGKVARRRPNARDHTAYRTEQRRPRCPMMACRCSLASCCRQPAIRARFQGLVGQIQSTHRVVWPLRGLLVSVRKRGKRRPGGKGAGQAAARPPSVQARKQAQRRKICLQPSWTCGLSPHHPGSPKATRV